jgi:hypothetical protein
MYNEKRLQRSAFEDALDLCDAQLDQAGKRMHERE